MPDLLVCTIEVFFLERHSQVSTKIFSLCECPWYPSLPLIHPSSLSLSQIHTHSHPLCFSLTTELRHRIAELEALLAFERERQRILLSELQTAHHHELLLQAQVLISTDT